MSPKRPSGRGHRLPDLEERVALESEPGHEPAVGDKSNDDFGLGWEGGARRDR
jgi:hypothetical protein